MSIPLEIRIGDRTLTSRAGDLMFRKTVHGTSEIACNLAEPLEAGFPAFERVYVYDGVGADTIAEGRLEDPGRTIGDDGERWDMTAVGESARTADRAAPYISIDTDLSRWAREQLTRATSADAGASEVPSIPGTDGLVMQYNPGQPIDKRSTIVMAYRAIEEAGMEVGGIEYTVLAGYTGTGFTCRMHADNAAGTLNTVLRTDTFSTTPTSRYATRSDSTPLPAGTTNVQLTARRNGGATNIISDNIWAAYHGVAVKALRYNLDGTFNTANADYLTGRGVYPHEVVIDVLARLLADVYDVPNAQVDTSSTHQISQLAYPDGITAEQLFTDLMEMVPDFYWQVGPSSESGKATFTWRRWPTSPRYIISLRDGLTLPGADAERYNRVTFRWTNTKGVIKTKTYDAGTTIGGIVVPDVPELATAGPGGTRLIRQPEIQDLADELGSSPNADQTAAEFLLAHGTPPASGTLTVAHKVYDNDLGRYVQPFEIEPGHLAFVPELADAGEDYSTTGRNGKSVFRIVGMAYQTSDNAAQLELDAPPRTDANLLAAQISQRDRKR